MLCYTGKETRGIFFWNVSGGVASVCWINYFLKKMASCLINYLLMFLPLNVNFGKKKKKCCFKLCWRQFLQHVGISLQQFSFISHKQWLTVVKLSNWFSDIKAIMWFKAHMIKVDSYALSNGRANIDISWYNKFHLSTCLWTFCLRQTQSRFLRKPNVCMRKTKITMTV